jgi:hypothetical protein
VNRADFLHLLHASKPLHRPFSSSRWVIQILRPIVEPTADLLAIGVADPLVAAEKAEPVGDDCLSECDPRQLVELSERGEVKL